MLPKIDLPTYDVKLPSNGTEVTIRPFLVKEEKLLLMVADSDDAQEIVRTVKQVITNCVITPELDLDKLPFFDIDYLFIALRAKSVSESVKLKYICENKVEGETCGGKFDAVIDIANVEIVKRNDISTDIKFNNDLMFKMKYPSYAVIRQLSMNNMDNKIRIICACVDKIFTKGQFYTTKDFTPTELQDFVENLTSEQFKRLDEFIMNFPSFVVTSEGTCPKCGFEHKVRYKDFMRFFR